MVRADHPLKLAIGLQGIVAEDHPIFSAITMMLGLEPVLFLRRNETRTSGILDNSSYKYRFNTYLE
jgi:hypothetical protein